MQNVLVETLTSECHMVLKEILLNVKTMITKNQVDLTNKTTSNTNIASL